MWQKLRLQTAGESHGKELVCILEGIPAHLSLSVDSIQRELQQRSQGFGRSGRMKLETDTVTFLGGVVQGKTTVAPIALSIANEDQSLLAGRTPVTIPRPGHADLAGGQKFNQTDLGLIAERASARETA